MGPWERRLWGAYYAFGFLMIFAAVMHTQAGGHGEYVILAGAGLVASLFVYDALHYQRFREWRLKALRNYRQNRG
jgi:hypothetical protein